MNIYLVRHGETDWNLKGKLQGREDIPLNDNGIIQAKLCGETFKNNKLNIKAIISSPLVRAKETARIISELLGIKEVVIEESLIERDFGELSGLEYDKNKHYDTFGTEEGIEPFDELCSRLIHCIKQYGKEHIDGNVIMVSHGAAINAVISYLTSGEKGSGKTRLKNGSINCITFEDNSQLKLTLINVSPDEFNRKMADGSKYEITNNS